jgi:hypothetical protein
MGFTDGGLIEPLLFLAFLAALVALAVWLAVTRLRLWHTQQQRLLAPRKALSSARDALAAVITDPAVFGDARDKALAAYNEVSEALNQVREIR